MGAAKPRSCSDHDFPIAIEISDPALETHASPFLRLVDFPSGGKRDLGRSFRDFDKNKGKLVGIFNIEEPDLEILEKEKLQSGQDHITGTVDPFDKTQKHLFAQGGHGRNGVSLVDRLQ